MLALTLALAACSAAVPTITLNDGNKLPVVSLGGGYHGNDTATSITEAFAAGFRAIDTALTYTDETGVGDGIRAVESQGIKRSEIFLTSKVPGCVDQATCHAATIANHALNLNQLGLDFVDMLLIHWTPLTGCDTAAECKLIQTQWSAMETLQQSKKAVSIGVSNFCPKCLECISSDTSLKVVPAVNQIEHHVGMGPDKEGIITYCKSKGIVAQAYSSLGPTFNQTAKDVLIEGPLTTGIGKAHNKSGAQVTNPLVTKLAPIAPRT
jgi:diketogulonate reductase-like aldo/keto reductase